MRATALGLMSTSILCGRMVTYQLVIKDLFDRLKPDEKLYAHHLARAAWNGSRIILRQTSAEGTGIFDFILELHRACAGQWNKLVDQCGVTRAEVDNLLEFAGMFLSSLGNYFGKGDQKVIPNVTADALRKMASISPKAATALDGIIDRMLAVPPFSLGFPDGSNQSNYYPSEERITEADITAIAEVMEKHSIEPENTRVRKIVNGNQLTFEILQASADPACIVCQLGGHGLNATIYVKRGDHAAEMTKICSALSEAVKYASNDKQAILLSEYIESFSTGSMNAYRKSQRSWVADISPTVENILGFVEPYRDPYGVRAEWEGAVCISDPNETSKLKGLVDGSTKFIRMLPWAVPGENDGKGPFEASLFEAPAFSIVHLLAFCTSFVWEASNLPNYSDIRETCGLKNLVYANRMSANSNPNRPCHYVHPSDAKGFSGCNHIIRFIETAVHELLGHGTGKLLTETTPGMFNFDRENLPISPLTGKAIETWYQPGQTWTSVFGKLATSVEECRAMLVSCYLGDDKEMLSMFGYDDKSTITADDLIYYTYIYIGVEGIQSLQTFNARDRTWGQPHARARFAILKHLLLDGGGVISVDHDLVARSVHARVDRSKILSHGKPSLGRMLCRIHVWRCIADVKSCQEFYDPLSTVDGEYEEWRQIVALKPEPGWKFVQPNTFLREDGKVELRTYDESNEGIIQSFVERAV